jgi:hypothetical protein
VTFLGDKLADVCDGYSMHMYADYWEWPKILGRCTEVHDMVAALPKEQRRPIYLTEFGFRGHRERKEEPGRFDDGELITTKPLYGLLCAWRVVDAIDNGFVCALHWDTYEAMYDRNVMRYGMIGGVAEGWPLRPHYWVFKLFTHTAKPGWQSVKVDASGKGDSVLVAAMRSPKGEWTIYAVNRLDKAQSVSISAMIKGATFHRFDWNSDGTGKLTRGEDSASDGEGKTTISIPPQALVALTTYDGGL